MKIFEKLVSFVSLYLQKTYVLPGTMNANNQCETVIDAAEHFPNGSITKIIFKNFL